MIRYERVEKSSKTNYGTTTISYNIIIIRDKRRIDFGRRKFVRNKLPDEQIIRTVTIVRYTTVVTREYKSCDSFIINCFDENIPERNRFEITI